MRVCVSVVRDLDKEVLHPQRGQDRTGPGRARRARGDKGASSFQGGCPHPVQLCGQGLTWACVQRYRMSALM